MSCNQCGTRTRELQSTEWGDLCPLCAFRQNERDQYGYGLAASTFGFRGEDE